MNVNALDAICLKIAKHFGKFANDKTFTLHLNLQLTDTYIQSNLWCIKCTLHVSAHAFTENQTYEAVLLALCSTR